MKKEIITIIYIYIKTKLLYIVGSIREYQYKNIITKTYPKYYMALI